MKKTILFLVIVLLFSCPSIQAKMSMRIISRNKRSHEEKTVVDNEEIKEVPEAVEVTETTEAVDEIEATEVEEVKEPTEVTEATTAVEVTETAEVEEVAGAIEAADTAEAVDAIEPAKVEEVKEAAEVTEATTAVGVTEASEATEAAEVEEIAGATESIEAAEAAEITETVEVTEVVGEAEAVEATEAEMPMRIISRYKRLYEERVVADNGEKKEATKSAVVEETEGDVEVTEATEAADTAEAVDAIEPANVEETVEVTEATTAVEATETSEVTEATEPTEAEAVEAVKVEVVEEAIEVIDVAEAKKEVEVTEVTKAVGVTVVSDATETKEVVETIEVTKRVEVPEISEATEVAEVTEAKEIKEPTESEPVDYEALGLRSVELNPNDYPDEVIALLEPHKNNEKNDSVLFYSSLGLAYKSKGRLKAAIAAYKRALKLVPNVPAPSIQYNLGIAYYYNNELHKSLSCFLNSSAQRPDHLGTEKWVKQLADELDIYKVPNTSKLKLVVNQKISVNRKKDDRESRIRMFLTQDGGRIQELSVKDKIYSYGIDSDNKRPVDYIIIDNDGDGFFDNVINTKGKFGVPTWAYNPE